MKYLLNFFKGFFTNRIAYFFVVIHWVLFIYALYQRLANDAPLESMFQVSANMYYEPLLLQILTTLDLPGIILAALISRPFFAFAWNDWLTYSLLFVSISLQWMLIGYGIERLIKRRNAIKK